MQKIYAIIHDTRKEAYIGRTNRAIETRFAQHLRDAANPRYEKVLSEALRHEPNAFNIVLCEEGENTSEAHWMQVFADEGYHLLNSKPGCKQPAKPKKPKVGDITKEVFVKTPEWQASYDKFMAEVAARNHERWIASGLADYFRLQGYAARNPE